MPELPDVEVNRRYLEATSLHRRVRHTRVEGRELLAGTSPQGLGRALKGHAFSATHRHGKYLFARIGEGPWMVLHFGMTGFLAYQEGGDPPAHTQCLVEFDDGSFLAYAAPRKLGRLALTGEPQAYVDGQGLGPDALHLPRDDFPGLAEGRRGGVKAWLMDQETMAGIGNVYSDEILFQARLHPKHKVKDLDDDALGDLAQTKDEVLKAAIEAGAEPADMPPDFLLPHRREGGRCPRCGGEVKSLKAVGRTAWHCPRCQQR